MTLFGSVLAFHVAAGAVGLVLGPVAMLAAKRPGTHTRAGEAYHWVMLVICVSAALLAVLDWARLWWFLPIAVGSYTFAVAGYLAAKRRWPGWLRDPRRELAPLDGDAQSAVAVGVDATHAARLASHCVGDLPGQARQASEALSARARYAGATWRSSR